MTRFTVNGTPVRYLLPADTPLLWALRDASNLTGTKYGCDSGVCGACTVHVDGAAALACRVTIGTIEGTFVTTIEGLADGGRHAVARAWIEEQVPQCGFCQPGMVMAVAALLAKNRSPSDADVDAAITNLCTCGTYPRVRRAISRAVTLLREDEPLPAPGLPPSMRGPPTAKDGTG